MAAAFPPHTERPVAARTTTAARIAAGDRGSRAAYFSHDADFGVIGRGKSIEAAFVAAAEAMFALITDLNCVAASLTIPVEFDEPDPEFALVTWLNRLLAEARTRGLAFGQFSLERTGDHWEGAAYGEPWTPELERGVEVKGATLTELAVRGDGEDWEARCVVDV